MIYLHEVHDVAGGKMDEFTDAIRREWRPLLEESRGARLLWFWHVAHGTGASYQAVSITAVRDWATWGALVEQFATDARFRDWQRRVWGLRREVRAKLLLPVPWSPLRDVDLDGRGDDREVEAPAIYLHDTGWPYPGKLEDYVTALGAVLHPQTQRSRMISIAACWTVAPGTGRHHEVVILQRVDDWERFSRMLTRGEQGAQRGGWMEEGLRYRDRWESKLLRCTAWSPRQ